MSSALTLSDSQWLIPPAHRINAIPLGQTRCRFSASCPAPERIRIHGNPKLLAADSTLPKTVSENSTLASRESSLELIRNREKFGLASTLEVRQGEQLVQVAAQAIPEIEQRTAQTENQIRLLLGEDPGAVARSKPLTQQEQPPTLPAGVTAGTTICQDIVCQTS